jgi:hypothetical protein
MSCCSWEDFEAGVIRVFGHAKIEEILIDWQAARVAWDKHHATAGEFANAAIGKIKSEGDYLFALPR